MARISATGKSLSDVVCGQVPRDGLPDDGHPTLSPKGRWLLCDTPTDFFRDRTLFIYDTKTHQRIDIGTFYTPTRFMGSQRCDLHPRWNRDGTLVCVDASHSGVRTQMTLDVTALLKKRAR